MITPSFSPTATERVLPKLALDFTTATLDPRVTFTRTTDATHPATYVNSTGYVTAATDNQPRFDYDPVTLLCKGLLIEESRTNSLLNTDLLSTQVVTVTAAVQTLSFYGTGSVTLSGAHTAVVSGTGAYPTRTTYSFTPTAGALTLAVTGAVQYAQLENGAFATSYIPTTTTALTRNADVATMTGTNFSDWYNATEGTVYAKADCYTATPSPTRQTVVFTKVSGASGYMSLKIPRPSAATGMTVLDDAGAVACDLSGQSTTANTAVSVVGTYKANSFAFSDRGVSIATDTSGNLPTGIDRLTIGYDNAATWQNGHIQKIMYWPQRLINAEVQAFSK